MRRISSHLYHMYTFRMSKHGLPFWEDKRTWTDANVSLTYGHYSLSSPKPTTIKIVPPMIECEEEPADQPATKQPELE